MACNPIHLVTRYVSHRLHSKINTFPPDFIINGCRIIRSIYLPSFSSICECTEEKSAKNKMSRKTWQFCFRGLLRHVRDVDHRISSLCTGVSRETTIRYLCVTDPRPPVTLFLCFLLILFITKPGKRSVKINVNRPRSVWCHFD